MGINIDISEKWRIKSDSQEFSLYKLWISEKGEPSELVVGHYSCLDHCLKWLINKEISHSDCTSLQEIIEHIKEFRSVIDEQLGIGIPDYSLSPKKY